MRLTDKPNNEPDLGTSGTEPFPEVNGIRDLVFNWKVRNVLFAATGMLGIAIIPEKNVPEIWDWIPPILP